MSYKALAYFIQVHVYLFGIQDYADGKQFSSSILLSFLFYLAAKLKGQFNYYVTDSGKGVHQV